MRLSMFRLALPCLVALLFAGCAATTDILRAGDAATPAKPARTLVIAGVTTDDTLRRRYENAFVDVLRDAGLNGIGSNKLIPSTQGLTMTELRERMHAATVVADAVLHVQLVALTGAPALSPQDIPAEQAPASRNVNGINLSINAPTGGGVAGTQYDIELQSTLYELPSRKLLWTVTTVTREANDTEAVARSHAKALLRALRERGLLDASR